MIQECHRISTEHASSLDWTKEYLNSETKTNTIVKTKERSDTTNEKTSTNVKTGYQRRIIHNFGFYSFFIERGKYLLFIGLENWNSIHSFGLGKLLGKLQNWSKHTQKLYNFSHFPNNPPHEWIYLFSKVALDSKFEFNGRHLHKIYKCCFLNGPLWMYLNFTN